VRIIAAILISFCLAAFAQTQTVFSLPGGSFAAHHTQVKLVLSADTAKPGDTILAGVDLKMEPGWHTYWKNPGAAGMATEIKWQLPPGVTAGEIQWPLPKKLPPAEVTTYGYEDEVMLIVPLTIETNSNLAEGQITLKANVSWLECKEVCIPANQDVEAKLNIGSETKNSADFRHLMEWRWKLPEKSSYPDLGINMPFQAWWEKSEDKDLRPVIIRLPHFKSDLVFNVEKADFLPYADEQFEVQAATEKIADADAEFHLRKFVKKFSGDWPKEISGVVILQKGDIRQGIEVKLTIADKASGGETISSISNPSPLPTQSLWQMLLYAFIGGLILNIMPCVLPVIALKILGFVSEAKSSPRRVRALGGIYAVGVLFSFLVLAAIVIGVKAAGHQAGWGMQFGSPIFIVCLTTLVTLVALNLFGVFEVTLGGRTLDAAGNLASRHGASGAFFNGVLATTLATPCTAPILGTALGFAFAQSASVIVLMFLTVGLGLAAPYVLLSWNPGWLKFLPKPGAWMEKFKIAMGFPMLGAVIWLFTLASGNLDKSGTLRFGLFLIALASAAWIWGEFVQRGVKHRMMAMAVSILLVTAFGAYAYFRSPDQINWQPWSVEAVAKARTDGKPVLVDFTADWCTTCRLNKEFAIEIPSVRAKLNAINATAFVGDYTHTPDGITAELKRYNRAGVPLVLVYPKNPDAQPIVLPEVLTPGIVLDALDRAAH